MRTGLLVASVIGGLIAVQVNILGRAADRLDLLAVSTMLQVGGLMAGLVWLVGRSGWSEVAAVAQTWWWVPLGALGWGLLAGLGFASMRAGVAAALSVSVASQISTGLVIGRAVSIRGLVGLALLVAGTALVVSASGE